MEICHKDGFCLSKNDFGFAFDYDLEGYIKVKFIVLIFYHGLGKYYIKITVEVF